MKKKKTRRSDAERQAVFDKLREAFQQDEEILQRLTNKPERYETVVFGAYSETNAGQETAYPIEWYVLRNTPDTALLLSKYALFTFALSEYHPNVHGWADSPLRAFLNDQLPSDLFSEQQKERMLPVAADDGCSDFITLPTLSDVDAYLRDSCELLCRPAPWIKDYSHQIWPIQTQGTFCNWYLRDVNKNALKKATCFESYHYCISEKANVILPPIHVEICLAGGPNWALGVRPMILIKNNESQ